MMLRMDKFNHYYYLRTLYAPSGYLKQVPNFPALLRNLHSQVLPDSLKILHLQAMDSVFPLTQHKLRLSTLFIPISARSHYHFI